MSRRTIPITFDLRTQKPIRQKLSRDDEQFLESKASGLFFKLSEWVQNQKNVYHTFWKHDWHEILSSIGVDEETTFEILKHLTLSDTPMTLPPSNQGACDSCWAIATSTSLTDRFRIAYQDANFPVLSPTTLMVALNSDPGPLAVPKHCCHANVLTQASKWVETGGLDTWCCTPYDGNASCQASYQLSWSHETSACEDGKGMLPTTTDVQALQCDAVYADSTEARHFTIRNTSGFITGTLPRVIQEELLERGTIIGEIILYPDFQNQCTIRSRKAFEETGGVYMHSMCFPRYRTDFNSLVTRTFSRDQALQKFFLENPALDRFGVDLSELWALSMAEIKNLFAPHQNKLVFLRCGFYGLNDSRYMPMELIGDKEKTYGQHALTVLGWGIQKNVTIANYGVVLDIPYWICRNSYGDTWCGDGYVKIGLSIHSHAYPDEYMFLDLSRDFGLEKNHYGTGLSMLEKTHYGAMHASRPAACPHRTRCGGASSPGVPDVRSTNGGGPNRRQGDSIGDVEAAAETSAWPFFSHVTEFLNSEVNFNWATLTGLIGILVIVTLFLLRSEA